MLQELEAGCWRDPLLLPSSRSRWLIPSKSQSEISPQNTSLSEDAISPKVKHLWKRTDFDEIAFGKKNQRRKSFR